MSMSYIDINYIYIYTYIYKGTHQGLVVESTTTGNIHRQNKETHTYTGIENHVVRISCPHYLESDHALRNRIKIRIMMKMIENATMLP